MKFKNKNKDDKPELVPEIIPYGPGGLEIIGRLNAEEYWEWRTTIEELLHADTKINGAFRDVKIKELETALLRREWTEAKNNAELAKTEYNKLKSKLEKNHKISLDETTIEPTNFEIRKLKKEDE